MRARSLIPLFIPRLRLVGALTLASLVAACAKPAAPLPPSAAPGGASPTILAANPPVPGGAPSHPVQGGDISGGGNAEVCFDDPTIPVQIQQAGGELEDRFIPHIRSIEMLDLVHAREPRNAESPQAPVLIEPRANESVADYIERIHRRMENSIPMLAWLLKRGAENFAGSASHRTNAGLRKIDDANADERVRDGCVLATMAAQSGTGDYSVITRPDGDVPELVIDQRLFDHPAHSTLSRAVLLLHEYLYLGFRTFAHAQDSRAVRKIISYLILRSPRFTTDEFVRVLDNAFKPAVQPTDTEKEPFRDTAARVWLDQSLEELYEKVSGFEHDYLASAPADLAILERVKALTGQYPQCFDLGGCSWEIERNRAAFQARLGEAAFLELRTAYEQAQDRAVAQVARRLRESWDATRGVAAIAALTWATPDEAARIYREVTEGAIPDLARRTSKPYVELPAPANPGGDSSTVSGSPAFVDPWVERINPRTEMPSGD